MPVNNVNRPHFVTEDLYQWYRSLPHGARPELAKILEIQNVDNVTNIFSGKSELPLEMALKLVIIAEGVFDVKEIYPEVTHTLDILIQKGVNEKIERFKEKNRAKYRKSKG